MGAPRTLLTSERTFIVLKISFKLNDSSTRDTEFRFLAISRVCRCSTLLNSRLEIRVWLYILFLIIMNERNDYSYAESRGNVTP